MAFRQLIFYGAQNAYIPKHEVVETDKIYFTQNDDCYNLHISRDADIMVLKHLVFELQNPGMTTSDFTHEINNTLFSLKIQNTEQTDHLSLYANLKPIKKIGSLMVIELPFGYTQQQLFLISAQYCEIDVKITNVNTNLFNNVFLTCEKHFLDDNARRLIAPQYQKDIQTFHTYIPNNVNVNSGTIGINSSCTFITQTLDLDLHVKGYFIELNNYDALIEVTLLLNDNVYFAYNKVLLDTICHKISDKMIYISFTNAKNYENVTLDSYIGSLYHDEQTSNVKMCLKFDNQAHQEMDNIKIHALCANVGRYFSGFYGQVYGKNRTHFTTAISNTVDTTNVINDTFFIPQDYHINNTFYWSIHNFNIEWDELYELLEDDKIMCPISYEDIKTYYCKCLVCNHNFDYNSLIKWLETKQNCPMCRSIWTNKKKYVNKILNNI